MTSSLSTPSVHAPPTPQRILETIFAFQASFALKAAIELDIFTAVASGAASAPEVAAERQLSERGCRVLCDYLTTYGFLTKEGERYTIAADAAAFLDRRSPMYLGSIVDFLMDAHMFAECAALPETVRRGSTPDAAMTADENPAWETFARAMAPLMAFPAMLLAQSVPLDADRETKVLDVAAGHGEWGIAFARHFPKAHITALDWSTVLEVARERARAAGIVERFATIAGDAFEVDIGHDYDLVLAPNFLHHFSEEKNAAFLRKALAALRSGGEMVVVDFVPNEDRVSPPFAARFALTMLAGTPHGTAYTRAEYERMMKTAGFSDIVVQPLGPTPHTVVSGRKR